MNLFLRVTVKGMYVSGPPRVGEWVLHDKSTLTFQSP